MIIQIQNSKALQMMVVSILLDQFKTYLMIVGSVMAHNIVAKISIVETTD